MAEIFVELLRPPLSLIIFGAGPGAAPLVRYAKELGWHVTLADHRAALLRRERFPDVDTLVIADQEKMIDHLSFTAGDAVVVMTHNINHDFELLKTLLPSRAGYIGLLGSRTKASALLKKLRDEGFMPTDMQLRRLYAPIGLDIGAEAPEEIALAIVAEVQAVLTGHPGGSLRSKGNQLYETVALAEHRAD
jgi:xanthine/CO dehydrogenase XdhC/CoxF family maturation factor